MSDSKSLNSSIINKNKLILTTKYLENITFSEFYNQTWKNYVEKVGTKLVYPRSKIDIILNVYEYESLNKLQISLISKSIDFKKFAFYRELIKNPKYKTEENRNKYKEFIEFYANLLSHETIIPRSKKELRSILDKIDSNSKKYIGIWGQPNEFNTVLITNMSELFKDLYNFDEFIGDWNTKNVKYMNNMFQNALLFKNGFEKWNRKNALNWDVTNVVSMKGMFKNASSFNSYISNWKPIKVISMQEMFKNASNFNNGSDKNGNFYLDSVPGDFALNWGQNIQNVKNFNGMFSGASQFNQELNWTLSTNVEANNMFEKAFKFNKYIGDWFSGNTPKIISMKNMFKFAFEFNNGSCIETLDWNTKLVTSFEGVFAGAINFNCSIESWDCSNVKSTANMFRSAVKFNKNLDNWDVSNVTNMQSMFKNATSFNKNLSSWKLKSIVNLRSMFQNAQSFNQDINNWFNYTSTNLKSIDNLFNGATKFNNGDLTNNKRNPLLMRVTNIKYFYNVFKNAESFNQDINWVIGPNTRELVGVFDGAIKFQGNFSENFNTTNITNMSYLFANTVDFNSNILDWNTHNLQNSSSMFENAINFNRNLSSWSFQNNSNAMNMFYGATMFNNGKNTNVGGVWNIYAPKLVNNNYSISEIMGPRILVPNFNQTINLYK